MTGSAAGVWMNIKQARTFDEKALTIAGCLLSSLYPLGVGMF